MNHLLGKFKIDLETWKQVIEADRAKHQEAGLHFQRVWKNVDDAREIYFFFDVDNVDKARSFLTEAGALDQKKMAAGEIPELRFIQDA